jgi:hypothetical protein
MVRNVFADEWRACLGAHYVHVLAEGDLRNAESLRALLLKAEYSETDVAALEEYVRAELGVALSGASEVEKAEAEAQSEAAAPGDYLGLREDDQRIASLAVGQVRLADAA